MYLTYPKTRSLNPLIFRMNKSSVTPTKDGGIFAGIEKKNHILYAFKKKDYDKTVFRKTF